MSIIVKGKDGKFVKQDAPDYICDRMLDILESTPLYQVKVKHLADYAGISRNTFYTYFDSVYAVVQMIEDRYLAEFFPDEVARAVLVEGNVDANIEHLRELGRNARVIRILAGAHGDPYFQERLARKIKSVCLRMLDENGGVRDPSLTEALCSYVVGGTIYLTKHIATAGSSLSNEEMRAMAEHVIEANTILLGLKNPQKP